jgi:hypothetical protein
MRGMATAVVGEVALATYRYQRLQTDIRDFETGLNAAYVVYPSAPAKERWAEAPVPSADDLQRHAEELGFERTELPPSTKQLGVNAIWARAMAATLNPDLLGRVEVAPDSYRWAKPLADVEPSAEELAFALYLVRERVIPMRMSPIGGQSLSELMSRSGRGVGGIVGAYEGMGHHLLLLATVPGGIIVGGAAMGVATALEQGLHERILRIIVPPSDPTVSDGETEDPEIAS